MLNKKRLLLLVFVSVLVVMIGGVSAVCDYNCDNQTTCQLAIFYATSGNTICVTRSFNTSDSLYFKDKNGITFDCLGNYIEFLATSCKGVILEYTDNIEIKNCIIKGNSYDPCDKCILVEGSGARHNYITKTEIHTCSTGILVSEYGSKDSYADLTVNQSYIHDNDNGIRLYGGKEMGLVLIDSVISNNKKGVYLDHQWGSNKDPRGYIYNSSICSNQLDLQIDTKDSAHKNCAGSYATTIGGSNPTCPSLTTPCPSFPSSSCVWNGFCSRYVPGRGDKFEIANINFCPAISGRCKDNSQNYWFCDGTKAYDCQGCGGWNRRSDLDAQCVVNECEQYSPGGWVKPTVDHSPCTGSWDNYVGCVKDSNNNGLYNWKCCPVWNSSIGAVQKLVAEHISELSCPIVN